MNEKQFDVTIQKSGQAFQLSLPGHTIDEAYTHAVDLATGKTNITQPDQILDFGTAPYDFIKVTEKTIEPQVAPPAPQVGEANGNVLFPFIQNIEYLGQKMEIKGVRTIHKDVGYVVLYEAAGSPIQTVFSRKSQDELTYYVGESFGYSNHVSLVPEGDLSDVNDAIEYLEDYVAEVIEIEKKKREDRNKTATAYVGFTEGE